MFRLISLKYVVCKKQTLNLVYKFIALLASTSERLQTRRENCSAAVSNRTFFPRPGSSRRRPLSSPRPDGIVTSACEDAVSIIFNYPHERKASADKPRRGGRSRSAACQSNPRGKIQRHFFRHLLQTCDTARIRS